MLADIARWRPVDSCSIGRSRKALRERTLGERGAGRRGRAGRGAACGGELGRRMRARNVGTAIKQPAGHVAWTVARRRIAVVAAGRRSKLADTAERAGRAAVCKRLHASENARRRVHGQGMPFCPDGNPARREPIPPLARFVIGLDVKRMGTGGTWLAGHSRPPPQERPTLRNQDREKGGRPGHCVWRHCVWRHFRCTHATRSRRSMGRSMGSRCRNGR